LINLEVLFNGIILGSLYGLMSSGYSLVYGVGKVANLAYGHMVVASIFVAYLTLFQWNLMFWVGAPIAVIVAVIISMGTMVLLERVTDNEQRVIFLSLGIAIILENILLAIFGGTYRFAPTVITGLVEFAGIRIQTYRIVVFVITIGIFAGLSLIVSRTRLGRSMRAVSQSEEASWLMGIDVKRVKFATSGIAGMLAGISAILLLPIYSIYPSMGWDYLLIGFAIVILGGLGSLNGTLLGGIILGTTESLFGYYFIPGLRGAVYFVVIIIVLLIRPRGLLGKKGASH
jgi:branched-chain amino acid transport system permease protein